MPQINPDVPPPFDQGVFLLHYNRGREAFHEGRYAQARLELEAAQRHRPNDADVLNLLGLVYFKTSSYPEAEVIYRRLVDENPGVFTLHSNLGLILFKLGNLDEAERFLLRAVELRPNYAKSHLYLGLLYKQRRKYGLALEHLQFAGAEKAMREVEAEMKGQKRKPVPPPEPVAPVSPITQPVDVPPPPRVARATPAPPPVMDGTTIPGQFVPTAPARMSQPGPRPVPPIAAPVEPAAATSAARKLQEAVDDTAQIEQPRLDLGRKIEGASKTFTLHENGFLEINFRRSVHIKKGTVSSYTGNLKFVAEPGALGGSTPLVRVEGEGKLFLFERGRKTFLLDLHDEFIYVEGGNLLALEDSLSARVESVYDSTYQKKIDTVKIFGKGSLAISTSIEPLTLRVTREYPLSISSTALVAWTGNLIPTVIDDSHLESVMIDSTAQSFKIRFDGDGVVVSEQ
ncbi:MAG: tetratricopeptide repeat protein [Thermoanaerobaculia bacterium]